MPNFNKVILAGHLTRDPELRTPNGTNAVVAFGVAVSHRRKNQATGEWIDEPTFVDVEAWDGREGGRQMATAINTYFRKGKAILIEGRLKLDQWTTPGGEKRSKLKVVAENFEFLEKKDQPQAVPAGPTEKSEPAPSYGRKPVQEEIPF